MTEMGSRRGARTYKKVRRRRDGGEKGRERILSVPEVITRTFLLPKVNSICLSTSLLGTFNHNARSAMTFPTSCMVSVKTYLPRDEETQTRGQ